MPKKKAPRKESAEAIMERASLAVGKRFKGALSERASTALAFPSVWFSTGSLVLDRLCAGKNPGGVPGGRVVHIPGRWSTGKSILLDHIARSCIRQGGLACISETEGSRDPHFANAIGLDLKKVELQRPATVEEMIDHGLEWHDSIRKQDTMIPLVWGIDSLDSTEAGRAAKEGLSEGGGWRYGGGKSEALAAGLRKVVQRCARYPTTLVMLNQTRIDPLVTYGSKERSSGGNPPHFYASLEVQLHTSPLGDVRGDYKGNLPSEQMRKRLGLRDKEKGGIVGRWVRAKIVKTKVGMTLFQEADFYIDFRKGISAWLGLLQQMIREGKANIKDSGEVTFRIEEGEILDFENTSAWMRWLADNPKYLLPYPEETQ